MQMAEPTLLLTIVTTSCAIRKMPRKGMARRAAGPVPKPAFERHLRKRLLQQQEHQEMDSGDSRGRRSSSRRV
jgi:hypothetical protein